LELRVAEAEVALHPPATGEQVLLEARSVSKRFGGITALYDISLSIREGEILGLVGPNGAGKTTLFNCLNGQLRPEEGNIWFDGQLLNRMPAYKRARLGIGRTFQRVEIFPALTVSEHILVALRAQTGDARLWKDLLNMSRPTSKELEELGRLLDIVSLTKEADTPVAALSLGHCRLVELGRALATGPRLLMADEPSSGLDVRETDSLARALNEVRKTKGTAILLVEHDLDMVAQVVDRVIVLDFGNEIARGPLGEVLKDPQVRQAYLGKSA
jgi:branched-chain amino acid transport system ATP-binding protein